MPRTLLGQDPHPGVEGRGYPIQTSLATTQGRRKKCFLEHSVFPTESQLLPSSVGTSHPSFFSIS